MPAEIEWLILADAAQAAGGKTHMLGAGWDLLTVNSPLPYEQRCAVILALKVPWNETNRQHDVEIVIEHEDGSQLAKIAGQVEIGRPPGIPPGSDQRTQIVAEIGLKLEKFGAYSIIGRLAGEDQRRVTFRLVPGPLQAGRQSAS